MFLELKYLSTSVASFDPVVRSLSLLAAGPQRSKGERGNSIDVRPSPPFSLAWLVADM
jgi:hypothetical protein